MTLQELKDNGVFPKLDEKDIIQLCINLKIPGIDANSTLASNIDEKYLDRIKYSTDLNNIKLKYDMIDLHNEVIQKYDDLITKYTAIRDSIQSKTEFASEVAALDKIIQDIETQKNDYSSDIMNMDRNNKTAFLNHNFTNQKANKTSKKFHDLEDTIVENKSENIKDIDTELRNLYENQNRLGSYKSKNIIIQAKMRRVTRKIARLQNKKGKIETSQRKIVTNSTTRYINKMNNRFESFYDELAIFENAVKVKQENIDRAKELEEEKKELAKEKMQSGRIGGKLLDISMNKKQKAIDRLNKKYCKVDLSKQYAYIFTESYVR